MALDEGEGAIVERPGAPSHKHVAWTRRRVGRIYKRKTINTETAELILFHVRWGWFVSLSSIGFRVL